MLPGPDVIRGKDAVLLHRQAVEYVLDVLGVDILAALGHDHVLLASEKLKMAFAVESSEVAGQEPAFNDGLERKLRVVQVVGHDCLAVRHHLSDSLVVRIQDAHIHARQGFADRIRAKGFEIVEREHRTGFSEAIAVYDRQSEVVEELHRARLEESPAGKKRQQLSSERAVYAGKESAAELDFRAVAGEEPVRRNHRVEERPLPFWQLVELCPQSALEIFQDHRHQRNIGDPVAHERIAHKLRPQRAQMNDTRPAHKRTNEPDHEINRMIRWQDAQVADSGPEREPSGQRTALLDIVLMRQNAALRPAARPGGIDDAGHILAPPGDEVRSTLAFEVLPAECA